MPITPEQLASAGTERAQQKALMCWASSPQAQEQYPELRWLFHVPNGEERHKRVALELKAMGVKPDVPDLCLPVARGNWQLLWIELKVPERKPDEINNKRKGTRRGQVRAGQRLWGEYLKSQGHGHKICYGWEDARQTLIEYLEFK